MVGLQALLHGLLQLDVDGDDDVLAVDRLLGLALASGDGRAVGGALLARVARLARKHVVVVQLEPGCTHIVLAVVLRVDFQVAQADDLAAHAAVGVLAPPLGFVADAEVHALALAALGRQLGRALPQALAHLHVGLLLHERVARVRHGRGLEVVRLLAAEHLGEHFRGGVRVVHLDRIDVDGGGLHGSRKHHAVAVVDGAAARLDPIVGHARVLALCGQRGRSNHLEVPQAQQEQHRDGGEHEDGYERTAGVGMGRAYEGACGHARRPGGARGASATGGFRASACARRARRARTGRPG